LGAFIFTEDLLILLPNSFFPTIFVPWFGLEPWPAVLS
jgi:hypothetical protein